MTHLLAALGDVEGLRLEVLRGNGLAARPLIDAVAKVNAEAAARLHRFGLNADGTIPWSASEVFPR
jgi:hypothetical protein